MSAAVATVLTALSGRGVSVTVGPSGGLRVRPVSPVTADERAFIERNAADIRDFIEARESLGLRTSEPVLRTLVPVPWDAAEALALQLAADAAVE